MATPAFSSATEKVPVVGLLSSNLAGDSEEQVRSLAEYINGLALYDPDMQEGVAGLTSKGVYKEDGQTLSVQMDMLHHVAWYETVSVAFI